MGSLDGLCINYNGYSQGIHTSVSKEVTCKTLKSVRKLLWAMCIYYGHEKFIALLQPQITYVVKKFNLPLPIPYKGPTYNG